MADLATLKSRIASEIHRDDLTSDIAYAISDAVKHYQAKPFWFNQKRGTVSTVAGQEFYDDLTDVGAIDTISVTVNGRKVVLDEWTNAHMENIASTTNTQSQPWSWAWYESQIRLYPVPDAVYVLTVNYTQKLDVPSSDASSNVWTTEAENLIRHAAKKRLWRDVIQDDANAIRSEATEQEALKSLNKQSNQLATGSLRGSM